MNNSQLDRVLRLVRRTGQQCVVFDREQDAGLVVMDLDKYEKMLDNADGVRDLSETDMLDKINRDLSLWREKHESESAAELAEALDFNADNSKNYESSEPQTSPISPEPEFQSEVEKPLNLAENSDDLTADSVADEVNLSDIPHDNEEEEFYLEPIE